MAISTYFTEELQEVDATKSFTYVSDAAGYDVNEWSVSGWTVTAGSDRACEHGAAMALYDMGFRFFSPTKTYRPASVPGGGATLAKQEITMPYSRIFNNYGLSLPAGTYFERWAVLNCVNDVRQPVGHIWGTIKNSIQATDGFFTTNPSYLDGPVANATTSFNLDLAEPDYTILVNRVAQDVVDNQLNEFGYASIDPVDGDPWPTDDVMDFCSAVCAKVRETVPHALLGVYAYAGHRAPPTNSHPNIYCQVSLAFGHLGDGYNQMAADWAEKVHHVALRGYGMIAAAGDWYPMEGSLCKRNSFENSVVNYTDFLSDGIRSINMETSSNFLPGLVGHYRMVRYATTGPISYEDCLDDIVDNIYGGSPEVRALFMHWSEPAGGPSTSTINSSCELVDLIPSEYRAEFEQYMAFWMLYHRAKNIHIEYDAGYWRDMEKLMRWVGRLQDEMTVHFDAFIRTFGNGKPLAGGRADLKYDTDPVPHYMRHPTLPTNADYEELKEYYARQLYRPTELDDTDLVLVNIPDRTPTSAWKLSVVGPATAKYLGPGTVTIEDEATEYGAGLHDLTDIGGDISWSGGTFFLLDYPEIRLEPSGSDGANNKWLYVPQMVRGRVKIEAASRIRFYDDDIVSYEVHGSSASGPTNQPNLPVGPMQISDTNTRNTHRNLNCNPWISSNAALFLMPRALAEREFPSATFG